MRAALFVLMVCSALAVAAAMKVCDQVLLRLHVGIRDRKHFGDCCNYEFFASFFVRSS